LLISAATPAAADASRIRHQKDDLLNVGAARPGPPDLAE
jgi:hypothetical protein